MANAFMVPEAAMAPAGQPGRAKHQGVRCAVRMRPADESATRLRSVLHVL
jgi:hypothetical protein